MNPSPSSDTDALRSDIDSTRRRMDDTMDALGDRLQPRHLLDELLGYVRGTNAEGEPRLAQYREKIADSAGDALHSVVTTVKRNPLPTLLIGAGVGWLIYESLRDKPPPSPDGSYYGYDREGDLRYDPDTHYDRPLEYPPKDASADEPSQPGEMKEKLADTTSAAADTVKEKLSHARDAVREKAGELKERAGEKLHAVKERASEMTARVKDGTRHAYARTRDRVVTTADEHPLEIGLVALAAGVLVGLALPTPDVVDRTIGPAADRLRDRTRQAGGEMMEKGKRVARAALSTVKDEARAQGLTPERLRSAAAAGVRPENLGLEDAPPGPPPTDPSGARPA